MKGYISSHFFLGLLTGLLFCLGIMLFSEGMQSMGWVALQRHIETPKWLGMALSIPFFGAAMWACCIEWKSWNN